MAKGIDTNVVFSGGRYVGSYGPYYLYVNITLSEDYDENTGTSNLTWALYSYADMAIGNGNGGTVTGTLTIAGRTYNINTQVNIGTEWTYIMHDTITGIPHDENTGEASFRIVLQAFTTTAWMKDFRIDVWGDTTVALAKISMGGTAYVLSGGQWKKGTVYQLSGGQWEKGKLHILNSGQWKKSKNA